MLHWDVAAGRRNESAEVHFHLERQMDERCEERSASRVLQRRKYACLNHPLAGNSRACCVSADSLHDCHVCIHSG